MNDKLQKLYDLYKQKGIINTTDFNTFAAANDAQRQKLYDLGVQKGLFNTTDYNTFNTAWSGGQQETLKKKEPTVSASNLEKPTSASSSKRKDDFYKGGLGEEKQKPKEIERPSNVFIGYPGKEKNEYRVDNNTWQRRQPGKSEWTTITNEGSISSLNKQFNKTVKPMTDLQKNELDKQVKRDADLEQRLNQVVTGNLVSQDELSARLSSDDAVAKTLKQSFPEFEFTARGGMSDRLDVVAPNGSTMELKLDNWTWDGDKEEANALKTFIRINSKDDTVKASQKIDSIQSQRKKEIDVATNKLAAENLLDRTQKFLNDPLAPVDSMALIKQKEEGEKLVKPISQKYQAPLKEAKEEYVKAKAEQFRDVYEMTRIDKSIDPKQAYASIRRDDRDIKIIGDYYNDVQKSAADLDKKQKEEQVRINTLAEKVKSGEMTMEEYDAIVKESNTLLAAQAKDVSANLKAVSTASKALDKSIGMNYIIEESRGSFGGGMAYKFVEGVTAIPRLLSFGDMSKEDQDELVKAITGGDTSTQYVESEKRGDLSKAMFSLAESLGVMASSAPLGALGSAARYAGFYGMSYYEMKDQLDEAKFYNKETDKVEKIPETDKVLLSAGYGVLSSVLENFGIDMALSKTAFGKNLANNIMKKAFLNLPKEATEAEIRAAINSSVNTVLGEIGVKAGIGASSEALTEASQSLAQVGIEEVYDEFKGKNFSKNKGLQDVLSNAAYEGYLGAIGGGVMSIAHSSPKALKVGFNSVYKKEELEALINATKIEGINSALVNNLKAELLTGNMSKEEANEIIQSFNKIQGSARSIPNNISSEGQAEALNLITERDKLNSEIEGKDPNLVVAQNERITEINNRLQEIAKENAVQEQSTNAIPVQSETGVSEQVEGGVPQSETQRTTGEVVGEEAQVEQAKTELSEEERQSVIDDFVKREREKIKNDDFLTEEEKQNSLTSLESDPIAYAESQNEEFLNFNASDFLRDLAPTQEAPVTESIPNSISQEDTIQYLGEPVITTVDDGELYEFRTEDGLIGGVMISPTEFRIDGISANEVGKGQGSKMFESLIDYLKSKGVTNLTTISAGEGAVKMHDKAVEKGLLTKIKEKGRTAEFIINEQSISEEVTEEVTGEVTPVSEPVATEATIGDIEVTEVPVAQETISEVEQLNNILTAEDFSEVNLFDKKSNKVAAQITKAAKAISKVLPKVKFVVHSTPEAFVEATENLDGRASEGGIYDHNTKTIHINLKNANSRTVAHEVFHALILSKVASDAEASRLTRSMIKAVIKSLKQADGGAEIISFLEDFESNYEDNIQNEEKLSELFAILADNYKKLPPATKNIIVRFLERMAKLVGIKPMTSNEITEFMNVLSAKVEAGEVISKKEVGKQKDGAVSGTRKQIIGEKGAERLDAMESNTRRMSNLVMAKNMTDDGKSPLEIRVATGWELGADGKWRYETVDNIPYLKDTVKQVNEFLADNKDADSIEQKAYFFLPPELIKMYPELNDITIEFGRGNEKEGSYSPLLKLIRVNVGVYPKNTVSVLLHEVQHVIQEIEGFDSGASLDRLMTKFVDREKGLSYRIKRLKGRGGNEALLEKAINDYREFVANFAIENNGKKILNAFNLYNRKSGEVEARNVQDRMNMTEEERRKTLLSETAEVKKPQQIFSENMFQPRKQKIKTTIDEFDGETTVTLDGKKIGKMFYDRSQRAWVNAEFDKTSAKPYTSKWIYGDSLGDTKAEAINELIRRNSEAKAEAKVEEPKKVTQYTNDQIINEFLTELNGKENIQRSPIGKEFIYGDKAFLEFSRFNKETGAREISIQSIASMDKGQGIGKAVMKDITDTADELGITLTLDAKPFGDTGLSKEALIKFYEKNGFVPDLEEAFGGEFETEEELIDYVLENEREALPMVRTPKREFAPRKQKTKQDLNQEFENSAFFFGGFFTGIQNQGIGKSIIYDIFKNNPKLENILLYTQEDAIGFWKKVGGEVIKEGYDKNGINRYYVKINRDSVPESKNIKELGVSYKNKDTKNSKIDKGEYSINYGKQKIGFFFVNDLGTIKTDPQNIIEEQKFAPRKQKLAPNGKPSKLNDQQWEQVRTPEFKAWFGDWENNPENASKVVDENGEPLVVYHGSISSDIDEFDRSKSKRISSGLKEFGTYFTDNIELAKAYSNWAKLSKDEELRIDREISRWEQVRDNARNNKDYYASEEAIKMLEDSKKGKIYPVFLNLRDIKSFDAKGETNIEAWNNLEVKASYKWAQNRDAMDFLKEGKFGVQKVDGIKAENIVDAFVQDEEMKKKLLSNVYLVFDGNPTAIKSATENVGTFSQKEFSIRKQKNSVDRLVNEEKQKGKTDQEIRDEAKTAGFTAKEASNALAKYYAKEEGVFVRSGKTGVTTKLYEGAKKFKEQYLKSKGLLPKIGFFLKEKMEGEISKETNRAVKTARKFGKMFEDFNGDKDLLLDSFDKFLRGDTTVKLPRKFAAVANEMRNHIDTLSKMLINVGAVEGELADVIRGNIGSYLTRSYEIYDNKNWRDDVAKETIVQAKNFLRSQEGMIAMAMDEAAQKNITLDEALDILVDNAIDDIFTKTEVTSLVSGQKLGSKDLSTLKEREDIPEQIRMLMGEYSDPAMNYARTVNNLIHLGARHKFLTDIKKAGLGKFFFEKNDAARPTGFNAQISAEGSKVMAPLNGLYTTPEIVQAFDQEFGEKEINKAMKLFYGAMGLVKWLKTIASVATHAKNVVSNLGFVMVNGHNITKLYDAFKVVKDDLKVMSDADIQKKIDEYIEAGIMRQGAGINEIRDMFKDANLDKYLERRLSNKKSKGTLGRIGQYLMSKGISTKIGLENAYQAEDDLFKIAAYENEVSRYANALYGKKPQNLTPEQKTEVSNIAAENVKNTYPTYSRIPEGIKRLRKIPLFVGSFISFQAESYRTAYNTIALAKDELSSDNKNIKLIGATRIAGATAYLTIKNALLSYFGMAFGTGLSGIVGALFDDDDEKEKEKDLREFLPPWAKNSDIIVKKNTDGTIEYIDFSASDPHGGINKALNAFFSGDDLLQSFTKSVLGVVEQFQGPDITVQLAMQIYNNADQYGNKIYNPEDTFDNNSKKIVDYIYDVIEPGTLTSTRKLIKEEDTKNVVIGELTGMKTRKIDVKQQFGFKLAEFDESFKDIKKVYNSEYNKTVRMMGDPKSTKKDIEEQKEKTKRAYETANELYNAKTQEMMKLINSANKLGVDYDAVMEEVKARKVISQYNLFEIEQGRPAVIEEKRY
jgi:L-amino acid N-acyltransferase YncA